MTDLLIIALISGGTSAAIVASTIRHLPPDWPTRSPQDRTRSPEDTWEEQA